MKKCQKCWSVEECIAIKGIVIHEKVKSAQNGNPSKSNIRKRNINYTITRKSKLKYEEKTTNKHLWWRKSRKWWKRRTKDELRQIYGTINDFIRTRKLRWFRRVQQQQHSQKSTVQEFCYLNGGSVKFQKLTISKS